MKEREPGKAKYTWSQPKCKVRNLHAEMDEASLQRVLIFLKVSDTHPLAPWIGIFHGMRARKKYENVAGKIFKDGYNFAVSSNGGSRRRSRSKNSSLCIGGGGAAVEWIVAKVQPTLFIGFADVVPQVEGFCYLVPINKPHGGLLLS